jgi:hypothetical protein
MFTKSVGWGRWSGYRSEILRAARAAGDVLQTWSGFPPKYEVAIDFRDGLAERTDDLTSLEDLYRDELRDVADVTIAVEPSRDAWHAAIDEHIGRGKDPPDAPTGDVRIRAWRSSGLRFEVRGEERTSVEGLALRLRDILGGSAPKVMRWDSYFPALLVGCLLFFVGIAIGPIVPRWWGVASSNGKWETGEVVGLVVGPILAIAIAFALWYVFPTIEILDDGELSRFRRLRAVLGGVFAAVVLGVVGSFVYDLVR